MKISKEYTIKLTWEELRDLHNALYDAIQHREGDHEHTYPLKEYKALLHTITSTL